MKKRMKGALGEIKPFTTKFAPEAERFALHEGLSEEEIKEESPWLDLADIKENDLLMIIEDGRGGVIGYPHTFVYLTHCYLGNVLVFKEDKLSQSYEFHLAPTLEFKAVNVHEHYGAQTYNVRFNNCGKGTSDLLKIALPSDKFISKLYATAPDIMRRCFGVKKVDGLMLPNGRLVKYNTK